jgi:hypothetical protein
MRWTLVFPVLLIAFAPRSEAELKWDKTQVELHPELSAATAVATFGFQNAGDKPVKITSVRPSCGCTTTTLAKNEFAPGEKGEIVATFKIGERSGTQLKTIGVDTDDPAVHTVVLTLKAIIPKLLEIEPAFLYWAPGEALNPKTITVKVGAEFPVTKLLVTASDPNVEATASTSGDPKQFQISVQPKESGHPISVALKIQPDFPKDPPKIYQASVRVR